MSRRKEGKKVREGGREKKSEGTSIEKNMQKIFDIGR